MENKVTLTIIAAIIGTSTLIFSIMYTVARIDNSQRAPQPTVASAETASSPIPIPTPEPSQQVDYATPSATEEAVQIEWDTMRSMILSCEANTITQTHDLNVYITIEGGNRVLAIEPEIDAVLQAYYEAIPKCGTVPIAIE